MTKTMLLQAGYRFRLYPTEEQASKLRQMLGCKRFVYNHFLARRKAVYAETGKSLSYEDCTSELPALKAEYEWLKEAHSQVLQQGLKDLDAAFKRFFRQESAYPKFKKKAHREAMRFPQGFKVDVEKEKTFIPKVGWVKTVFHRVIEGEIRNITISLSPSGKFHASIQTRREVKVPNYEGKVIGLDLGLQRFYTSSENEIAENPRHLQKSLKRLKRYQRQLSRKQKGSKAREKARRKVAKAHEKVRQQRTDFLHKQSYRLVNENQVISLESLNIRGMMQNSRLAQSIGAVGWHEFLRQLDYKGKRYGCDLFFVPRFFPSSKTCSNCAYLHSDLKLSERNWRCPDCQSQHDRDLNAAINLRNYLTAGTVGKYASGEGSVPLVSLGETLKEARSFHL